MAFTTRTSAAPTILRNNPNDCSITGGVDASGLVAYSTNQPTISATVIHQLS